METSINDNGFDQEEWKKVQPQLQKTWDEYAAAGKTSDEFIDFAAEMLGSKGKPYFDKFIMKKILDGEDLSEKKEESKEAVPQKTGEISNHDSNQPASPLSSKLMESGIAVAGFHIEAGTKDFADFTKAMFADLGTSAEILKPYFRSWYEAIRHCPGIDTEGMTDPVTIDKQMEKEAPPLVYPEIDRRKFIPNRGQDAAFGEGNFKDGRPFRVEMWFDQGYTYLTYFLPKIGIEEAGPETLRDMLVSEGIIDFHDERFHDAGYDSINLDVKEGTDDADNEMWLGTVIVGEPESEEVFISDHVNMKRFEFKYKRDGKPEEYLVALMDEDRNYQPYFVNNSDEPIELMRVGGSNEYKDIPPRSFVKFHFRYLDWYFDWTNEINVYIKTKDEEFYLCYHMRKYFIGDFLAENGKLDEIPVMNKPGLLAD